MRLIAVAADQGEAMVWQSCLRAAGIPSLVKNQNAVAYLQAPIPFVHYDHELFVPDNAVARSRQILAPSLKKRGSPQPPRPLARHLAFLWFILGPGQLVICSLAWPVSFVTRVLT